MSDRFSGMSALGRGLVELVFPRVETCAVCDGEAIRPGVGLCRNCLSRLPLLVPPLCPQCGRLLRLVSGNEGSCRECARERFFFSRARALCLYEGAARAYLHDVKFRRAFRLAKALAAVLAVFARERRLARDYDLIVPVPLHSSRQEERGFNQAGVFAAAVGEKTHRRVCLDALARTRRTKAQSGLDREWRRCNVREAFIVPRTGIVAGRRILLVDDILTTGYTASECARSLLRAGALEVGVLTLANGVIEDGWFPPSRFETDRDSAGGPGDGGADVGLTQCSNSADVRSGPGRAGKGGGRFDRLIW